MKNYWKKLSSNSSPLIKGIIGDSFAFTLIELIVWITISMLLMVSVGVFMSSGMQNIFMQQKVLENVEDITDFSHQIFTALHLIQSWAVSVENTGSWIIFKRWQHFWDGWFSYIGTQIIDEAYCSSDADETNTNHLFIKSFIPFEEVWEDMFSDYDDILKSQLENAGWTIFQSIQKDHSIINFTTKEIVIGKWVFGDSFTDWAKATDIYLNSPTWLTSSWNILFLSDTLNNRVLYYDTDTQKIFILLDESDGLDEPTGLHYDNWDLIIANSGKWEILKYSSKTTNLKLDIDTDIDTDIDKLKKIELELYPWITSISEPNATADFIFWGDIIPNAGNDYFTGSMNTVTYWLSNFWNTFQTTPNTICSSNYTKYYEDTWDIIKEEIQNCNTSTGTLRKYRWLAFQNIQEWDNIQISTLWNIEWVDITRTWNYITKLSLSWQDGYFTTFLPLFTISDNDILTPWDNTLEVLHSWLSYPTWVWGENLWQFNEFWDGVYSDLEYSSSDDILLDTPISELDISLTLWDLLSLVLKYYKSYNCYNIDDNAKRTMIFYKNIK